MIEIGLDYVSDPWGMFGPPPVRPEAEHRYLSADQLAYLDQALGDIPALLADLEIAATKQSRFPAAPVPVSDGSESPLPYATTAAAARDRLQRSVIAAAVLVWNRTHHQPSRPNRKGEN